MVAVDIVSDIMCPWCYIGKRKLEGAMPLIDGLDLDVRWRPYQLDPTIPREGRDRREYLKHKFGSLERAREIYDRVEAAGREVGIDFHVDAITVSPNTLDAHRLIRWSHSAGRQDDVVERLFQLYFLEGANLCDREVLADAADEAGMDRETVSDLLASDADETAVREEVDMAYRMGISGVPSFIVAQRYLVSGAQSSQVLAEVIGRAAGEADKPAESAATS